MKGYIFMTTATTSFSKLPNWIPPLNKTMISLKDGIVETYRVRHRSWQICQASSSKQATQLSQRLLCPLCAGNPTSQLSQTIHTKEANHIGQPLSDYPNVMPSMTESAN
jgi:hypothetical protein